MNENIAETPQADESEASTVERLVMCIGVDNKQHVCLPENSLCKCGVNVKRKKLLRDDHLLYSCYECTY